MGPFSVGAEGEVKYQEVGTQPAGYAPVQTTQLLQFLGWLILVVLGFALLSIVAFAAFRDVGSGLTGATLLAYGCFLLLAHILAHRRRPRLAVLIICSGFLLATLAVVIVQPNLVPVLTLAPLLAVGVALPYAAERILLLLFVVAWLVTVAVAVLGEILPHAPTTPVWYESGFRIASLVTAAAIVLLLLWQFRSRLVGALVHAKAAEERAVYDATHDKLTGLPNRAMFLERLGRALERAREDKRDLFAVLFLDLDRFKNVNDSLGHSVGDLLLVEVSRRLETCVHPTDTVARLGGDEYTILLENLNDAEDATRVAERLQEELRAPFNFDGHELYATASIGIVSDPIAYQHPEDLLRDADTAMYRAKEGGKARYEVFTPEMRARAVRLLRLETDLRRAVADGEFVVYYQPIVSLRSGQVVGFEALARWEHPSRGLTPPEEFIPLAEETELIVPIGLSVLREACRATSLWHQRFPDRRPLDISVNLSVAQLARPDLNERIGRILDETNLHGRNLRLEITESVIVRDTTLAAEALSNLRSLGVRVHVDDFGTGYSSLSVLHRLPVDALKIDRSFVIGMSTGSENAQIVRTIATLAHGLGMDVVAEGVDEPEQLGRLREIGCDYAQGHYFSEPMDAQAAEAFISAEPRW